eukprot:211253_1
MKSHVEEAIRNAELGWHEEVDETSTKEKSGFDPKNNLEGAFVPSSHEEQQDADEDALMQSFYERHEKEMFPPLPIKEWKSLFPNLRLSEESVRAAAARSRSSMSMYANDAKSRNENILQKEKLAALRWKLKEQLRRDLLEHLETLGK